MGGGDEEEAELLTPSMLSNHKMETLEAKMSKRAADRVKDAAAQRKAGEAAIGISHIQTYVFVYAYVYVYVYAYAYAYVCWCIICVLMPSQILFHV